MGVLRPFIVKGKVGLISFLVYFKGKGQCRFTASVVRQGGERKKERSNDEKGECQLSVGGSRREKGVDVRSEGACGTEENRKKEEKSSHLGPPAARWGGCHGEDQEGRFPSIVLGKGTGRGKPTEL